MENWKYLPSDDKISHASIPTKWKERKNEIRNRYRTRMVTFASVEMAFMQNDDYSMIYYVARFLGPRRKMCELCAMCKTGIRNGHRRVCACEAFVSKFTIKNVQRKFLASRCGVNLCNDKNETCSAYIYIHICGMRLGAGACDTIIHFSLSAFFSGIFFAGCFAPTNGPNSMWSKWSSSKRATCECLRDAKMKRSYKWWCVLWEFRTPSGWNLQTRNSKKNFLIH